VDSEVNWLRIGQLAGRTGVSAKTLRFYDDAGVLVASTRSPAGYRLYDPGVAAQVELVRAGQAAGMRLDEIAGLFDAVDRDDDVARAAVEAAVARIDQAQIRLDRLRNGIVGQQTSG
jgi:DNA-binding transcriptional MerR regulator